MSDRGEKIVNLAREMLRAEQTPNAAEMSEKISAPFRAFCIATIVAALGSACVTNYFSENRRPISRYERVELEALVFYAARIKGMNEDVLRQEVENRVGINDFGDFSVRDYRSAKNYLQSKIR